MFENPDIEGLDFKYLAFICLNLWDRKIHTSDYLEKVFEDTFASFTKHEVRTITFAEIDSDLGYPPNSTCKAFLKALHFKHENFTSLTIVFTDVNHQSIYMGTLKTFGNDVATTNENASIAQSVYF